VGVCLPSNERVGPGDRFLVNEIAKVRRRPTVAIVTKADLVDRARMTEHLIAVQEMTKETGVEWDDIVPVSAVDGTQIDLLSNLLVEKLPPGPPLYPEGELTDEPEEMLVAELIREAVLEGVRDELPHSVAVLVEEMKLREDRPEGRPLLDVYAHLYVERPSQKAIVIGAKGRRLVEVGTAARKQIETLLGTPIYLDLRVKVAKDWQRDPKQLRRLGF
jgi:GTP-binding protein Era